MQENHVDELYPVKCTKFVDRRGCVNRQDSGGPKSYNSTSCSLDKQQEPSAEYKSCGFQHRYLVAATVMVNFVFINLMRSTLAVAMTAMLNTTHEIATVNVKVRKDECDFHTNATAHDTNRLEGEFNWSPDVQGYILGASFLGYCLALLPAGALSQKFGGEKIMTYGIFLYSIGFLASPTAARFHYIALLVVQLISGFGHATVLPGYAIVTSNWFPKSERGLFNPIILSGYSVGSVFGSYAAGLIAESEALGGWPSAFYIFGIISFLNGIWNKFSLYESPKVHPKIKKPELDYILGNQEIDLPLERPPTPWGKILTSVPVYATIAGIFATTWLSAHAIVLYAPFAGIVLNFTPSESGLFTSICFILITFTGLVAGYVPNWLTKKGYVGVNKLRKGCQLIAVLGYSAGLVAVRLSGCSRTLINVFSICSMSFIGFGMAGAYITPMDMSPMFAGSLMSVCGLFGMTSSFIFPFVAGIVLKNEQTLGQWYKIFDFSIGLCTSIGILYCLFGSADVQPWNFPNNPEDLEKSLKKDSNEKNDSNSPKKFWGLFKRK